MEISLKVFKKRWGNPALLASQLSFNALQFAIKATEYAINFFKKSFDYGGFYKSGSKWAPRKDVDDGHRLMVETGELKNSIRVTKKKNKTTSHQITVSTTETFGGRVGRKRRPTYAAVHNERWQDTGYWSNQYKKSRPIQRQFMGHNKELYRYINKNFVPILKRRVL